jgi:AcrR family transcriptional regulator
MVMTPWGNSESLWERRLRPGPGTVRAEVEQNQRERLFGAMIALVAEKGYEATTLNDLAEVSGVSSRSFYQLYESKQAIFEEALQTVTGLAVALATQVGNDPELGGWEERARAGSHAFAEMVVAQPAAARLVLIEGFGAGREVVVPLEGAIAGFEALAREIAAQSPERAEMPAEMIGAYTGAIEEIVRMRLLAGEEAELPDLIDALWDLIGTYRPPPEPLRLVGRPAAPGGESLEAHDNAERVIRALAVEVAERGYRETTVADVLARGKMSATTLYDVFAGKEEAMAAALDSAGAQMGAAMSIAARRAPDWAASVRAAVGALFTFLASRPALARLMFDEAYVAGAFALERRVGYLEPLEKLLREGDEGTAEAAPITAELIAGVFYSLGRRAIREGGPGALPGLAPLFTYLALAPYVGDTEACAAANGDGGRRRRRR